MAKNYAKHGFKNIIITDLENERISQLAHVFEGYDYTLFTLRVLDDNTLKARVLDESRSSGYRDWQASLKINQELKARKAFPHEEFIDVEGQTVEEIVGILERAIF